MSGRTRPDVIVGIDPGKKGAFAVAVHGNVVSVDDLPIHANSRMIDPRQLDRLLIARIAHAQYTALLPGMGVGFMLEGQLSLHGIGTKTISVIFTGWGIVLSAAIRHADDYEDWENVRMVAPNQWKKDVGVTSDKETSLALARTRWPHLAHRLARKKDDGRAEAALLARYGHDTWDLT